jgi:hypothetical protein
MLLLDTAQAEKKGMQSYTVMLCKMRRLFPWHAFAADLIKISEKNINLRINV